MRLWPTSPLAFSLCFTSGLEAQDWTSMRARMVTTQIERRGVKHPGVLAAMREIPRHLFVPEAVRSSAYEDRPLPIGHGQTISQPYIVGSMTELLDVKPGHKVLEIGTGSGYQAAVLCRLAARVFSIEIVEPLARESYARLQTLGCGNVRVRAGDGYLGWPEESPFDRIILTAAPPEIPQELVRQLKNGGRLIAPVGRQWQDLVVIDKDATGKVSERVQYPVVFVPMVPGRK